MPEKKDYEIRKLALPIIFESILEKARETSVTESIL